MSSNSFFLSKVLNDFERDPRVCVCVCVFMGVCINTNVCMCVCVQGCAFVCSNVSVCVCAWLNLCASGRRVGENEKVGRAVGT